MSYIVAVAAVLVAAASVCACALVVLILALLLVVYILLRLRRHGPHAQPGGHRQAAEAADGGEFAILAMPDVRHETVAFWLCVQR